MLMGSVYPYLDWALCGNPLFPSWCASRGVVFQPTVLHDAYSIEEWKRSFKSKFNGHKQTLMSRGQATMKQRIKLSILNT